jgi:hypothetical protein
MRAGGDGTLYLCSTFSALLTGRSHRGATRHEIRLSSLLKTRGGNIKTSWSAKGSTGLVLLISNGQKKPVQDECSLMQKAQPNPKTSDGALS